MPTALVTGSAGFIGRHFYDRLLRDGWTVAGCDIDPASSFETRLDCRRVFEVDERHYDLVVHCAAIVGGRANIDGNPLAIAENLAIDSDFARWCLRARPGRVVYFSSSAAYPVGYQGDEQRMVTWHLRENLIDHDNDPDDYPHFWQPDAMYGWVKLTGERPMAEVKAAGIPIHVFRPAWQPDAMYGWVKLTGERLMAKVRAAGIPIHVFRPFSGYGADQSTDYPFPAMIERAKRGADPFQIWGDGKQVRDWVHVDDIVNCVMAAIEQDYQEPLNIGTGIGTSMNDLAAMICATASHSAEFEHLLDKPVGVQCRVADTTNMVGIYTPEISLEEGVARCFR